MQNKNYELLVLWNLSLINFMKVCEVFTTFFPLKYKNELCNIKLNKTIIVKNNALNAEYKSDPIDFFVQIIDQLTKLKINNQIFNLQEEVSREQEIKQTFDYDGYSRKIKAQMKEQKRKALLAELNSSPTKKSQQNSRLQINSFYRMNYEHEEEKGNSSNSEDEYDQKEQWDSDQSSQGREEENKEDIKTNSQQDKAKKGKRGRKKGQTKGKSKYLSVKKRNENELSASSNEIKLVGQKRTLNMMDSQPLQSQDPIRRGKRGRKPKKIFPDYVSVDTDELVQAHENSEDYIQLPKKKEQPKEEKQHYSQNSNNSQSSRQNLPEQSQVEFTLRQEMNPIQQPNDQKKLRFQDVVLTTTSMISVQQLKKYVQLKLNQQAHVELNEIEIYANIQGEKTSILKNKETIFDLICRGLLKQDKMIPGQETVYSYWNGGRINDSCREILYVKLKHPAF